MATWSANVHLHPWFKMVSLKRSHSSDDHDSDDDSSPSTPIAPLSYAARNAIHEPLETHPPRKRLRSNGLEGSLSRLSLFPPHVQNPSTSLGHEYALSVGGGSSMEVEEPVAPPPLAPSRSFAEVEYDGFSPVTHASFIEEPSSSAVPEVRMRGTPSWYEPVPDRIIVTDLDASDEEDEDTAPHNGTVPIVLPSALDMLYKRIGVPPIPPGGHEARERSLALVPFRPLPFLQTGSPSSLVPGTSGGHDGHLETGGRPEEQNRGRGVDAMDVEPMDIEL